MLIPLLLALVPALVPLQDDATRPGAHAPAQESAPAETPASVVEFLADVDARVYDPRDDGLVSVAFRLPVHDPTIGHVADARVSWRAGSEPDVEVEMRDFEVPPMLLMQGLEADQVRDLMSGQAEQSARQFLDHMLGRMVEQLEEGWVGSMAGAEEGLVKVRFTRAPTPENPVREQVIYVDDESVIQKEVNTVEMGPMGRQEFASTLAWEPAKEEGDDLVVVSSSTAIPAMGVKQKTSFAYRRVGDVVLLSQITTEVTSMMGTQTVTQKAEDLVVNEKPADAATEPGSEPAKG